VTLVTVRCGGLSVSIRVDDPLSRKTVLRTFDTGPLDRRARARWIALAASELVLSSWVELETNPTPQVRPEGPPAPAPVRRAAQAAVRRRTPPLEAQGPAPEAVSPATEPESKFDTDSRSTRPPADSPPLRAVGLASVRSFFSGTGSLWGGGMRLSHERFTLVSWSTDFLFEAGTLSTSRESYEIRSGTLGGWLMLYKQSRLLTARLGAGLRMGVVATIASEPNGGTEDRANAVAPWGWPLAAASLTVGNGPIVIEYGMEGGYVVLPVAGTSRPSLRGSWFSAQLGFGIRLGARR
jgi:hypothetical protein